MKPLVIYHDNCVDGFAAAWAATKALGECELYPAKYKQAPPYGLAKARHVYVVDFSYPREELLELYKTAGSLHVFDHHKTAEAELQGLDFCVFDMNRSGAGLTWDTLFDAEDKCKRPAFIDYIEDRDLWRFKLPASKAVNAYIGTVPRTLEAYDALENENMHSLYAKGAGCLAQLEHYARETEKLGEIRTDLFGTGLTAICINCSPVGVSEVCDAALQAGPIKIAMGWYCSEGKMKCSLRSSVDGPDVSAIAKGFGGGGHEHAAGFALNLPDLFLERVLGVEP